MLPTKRTDLVADSRTLLLEQFKNRRVITGVLDVLSRRAQDIEDMLWDVIDKRLLANAQNAQVDALGRIVGEKRDGRGDTAYKKGISLRIRVNRSKGRAVDLLDIATIWSAATSYVEYRFLAWSVEIDDEPDALYLARLLTEAKATTSYGLLRASTWPTTTAFGFRFGSVTTAPSDDQKWDSAYA